MAAPSTPCASGSPLDADFDGDGLAELVIGAEPLTTNDTGGRHWVQPGAGGAATWIEGGEVQTADLNGDVCADALLFDGGHHPWLKAALGTPEGLDLAGEATVTIPQAAAVEADGDPETVLVVHAAGLRHDGFSQIVVAGYRKWEIDPRMAFVDVLTLDGSLGVTGSQVMEFPGVDTQEWWITGFGVLATSGGTVAVGVPNATVKGHAHAGAVWLYTPDVTDPTRLVRRKVLSQHSPGVPGTALSGDHFGAALAMRDGRLAIGIPGERDPRHWAAGQVQPILWNEATNTYTAYRAINQNTRGVPGTNESYDEFGSHLALARGLTASGSYDILIGADEGYGKLKAAGSVTVANFTRSLYRGYTQASAGIPGNPQAYDHFDRVGVLQNATSGVDTVVIGSPGEDSNGTGNLGRVIRSDGRRLGATTTWSTVPIPSDAPRPTIGWGLDVGA